MIDTITKYSFQNAFHKMGRGEQFSYEGLDALFDYFEMLEEDTDQQIELDVIAICCEYSEYDNLEDLKEDYSCINDIEDLEMHTTVIPVYNNDGSKSDKFIIQQF